MEALSQEAPAVLFSAIKLANGQSLFKQKLLLDRLNQQQSRLMLYSDQDNFDLRVKAAQHSAEAFFVSPVDVPNMIATISELLEQTFGQYGRVLLSMTINCWRNITRWYSKLPALKPGFCSR